MGRKSPQEKKRLSYARDRRNDYGENDKSSRKGIRRNKRAPHRANRRRANQILESAVGVVNEAAEEETERRLLAKRPKVWRKFPDVPLGEVIQRTLRRRIERGIDDPEQSMARLERVRRRLGRPAD